MIEKNKIQQLLLELGLSTPDSIIPFYSSTRDRKDISVLKCKKTGVIFLSSSEHINSDYYAQKNLSYWGEAEYKHAVLQCIEDDQRRSSQFGEIITNKKWLDVGTGAGGILNQLSPFARETYAIEPQNITRQMLLKKGYNVFSDVKELNISDLDIVTLFHVFEHFNEPMQQLLEIKEKMNTGAKIIIEVPHANDFLISFLECEAFKKFTFWSEHLILHTRISLEACLATAGFQNILIKGFQRYPISNHLHWLRHQMPGGHVKWSALNNVELDSAYANMLAALDKTDTLIAIAEK